MQVSEADAELRENSAALAEQARGVRECGLRIDRPGDQLLPELVLRGVSQHRQGRLQAVRHSQPFPEK
jgi:hypothetical protein